MSFAGATVHDMFNWLTVIVLLPVEMIFGYLENVTYLCVKSLERKNGTHEKEPELLNVIIKPLTNLIIQIDKQVLDKIAVDTSSSSSNESVKDSLIKKYCSSKSTIVYDAALQSNKTVVEKIPCHFLFANLNWPEWAIGSILLILSLVMLCGCLILMVKILNSMFQGPVAHLIKRVVNADFPGIFKHFTGYIAIVVSFSFVFKSFKNQIFKMIDSSTKQNKISWGAF